MNTGRYRIGELAEKAGVTRRTIHYYMGRGLLPSPDGAGLSATYSDEHLYRILLIKKLQETFLPLEEIKRRMSGMSAADVRRSLEAEGLHERVMEKTTKYVINEDYGKNRHASKEKEVRDAAGVSEADGISGIAYEQLNVGFGLEIHFPAENKKARELAGKLYKYADRIIRDS